MALFPGNRIALSDVVAIRGLDTNLINEYCREMNIVVKVINHYNFLTCIKIEIYEIQKLHSDNE